MNIFWLLLVALACLGLQALLFGAFNLRGVGYSRAFNRPSAYEGERVELVEVIRNRKILPVPWLRVESRISPFLRFASPGGEDAREISAEQYHKSVFSLAPFSQVTRRHEIACLKRGHYDVGVLSLTAGDLFSLSVKARQLTIPCALDVYPRLLGEEELATPSTRWQGELVVKRWISPDPFLTASIREYRAGDSVRDVHWRATARTGKLQVKVRDYTADPRMMVVLNVQNSEEQWGDLMDYEQEGIEQGIRIAATLCVRALSAGVEAGFACNGCLQGEKGSGRTVMLPARRSREQADLILTALARLEIHREATFPTFLDDLTMVSGIDIVLLSTYDSEAIQARVRALRARGNSVTLLALERGRSHAAMGA